ncbi:MAG: hypothetical protein U9M96_02640 [Thermodesulfobacteriota bacterium]|nr:hypothetical protein [Thermodesulfobacteriota bacterium]
MSNSNCKICLDLKQRNDRVKFPRRKPARVCLSICVLILCLFGCSTKYAVKSPEYDVYGGEANQHTRLIQAERSRIFQILTHEETFQKICLEDTIVTYEPPLPYQVGTFVGTKINHIFKLEWHSRVEEVIPDTKIRLQFLDSFFAGGTEIWELQSIGESTRVSHTIIVKPKDFVRKMLWVLKVRFKHNKMVEAFLDNLKRVSETN